MRPKETTTTKNWSWNTALALAEWSESRTFVCTAMFPCSSWVCCCPSSRDTATKVLWHSDRPCQTTSTSTHVRPPAPWYFCTHMSAAAHTSAARLKDEWGRVAQVSASSCTLQWKHCTASTALTAHSMMSSDSICTQNQTGYELTGFNLYKQWHPQWNLGGPPATSVQIIVITATTAYERIRKPAVKCFLYSKRFLKLPDG